jgi:hypothetical protein
VLTARGDCVAVAITSMTIWGIRILSRPDE